MKQGFIIGIVAGLACAVLFAAGSTGSLAGFLLFALVPLPILIVGLGWHQRAGLVAALVAAGTITLVAGFLDGIAFALTWAFPAWWLAYLALLARADGQGKMEWYGLGNILIWIGIIAASVTVAIILLIGGGSYETFLSLARQAFETFAKTSDGSAQNPFFSILLLGLPFIFANSLVFFLALNLWLAANAVRFSGRLLRPWPFIPATRMPAPALGLLAVALILAFAPGFLGAVGLSLAGAAMAIFALQGLAYLHDTWRDRPRRALVLSGVYLLLVFAGQLAVPLLALVGCADVAFALRPSTRPFNGPHS